MALARAAILAPLGAPPATWTPPVPREATAVDVSATPRHGSEGERGAASPDRNPWVLDGAEDPEASPKAVPSPTVHPGILPEASTDAATASPADGQFRDITRAPAPGSAEGALGTAPDKGPGDVTALGPGIHPQTPVPPPPPPPLQASSDSGTPTGDPGPEPSVRTRLSSRLAISATALVTLACIGAVGCFLFVKYSAPHDTRNKASSQPPVIMSTARLSGYEAQDVSIVTFDEQVLVTWKAPQEVQDVAGYIVVSQTPDGRVLDRRVLGAGDLSASFSMPPVTPNSCVVVTTLAKGVPGQHDLELARGTAVCLNTPGTPGTQGAPVSNSPDSPDSPDLSSTGGGTSATN